MGLLSKLAFPPWFTWKLALQFIVGILFMALLWSWNDRGHQVQRLADFQSGVVLATSQATVAPDKNGNIALLKPEQVAAAIATLKSNEVAARTTIKQISGDTLREKTRADAADKKLTATLKELSQAYKVSNKRITYLETRLAVPPDQTCKVIEDDTNSAWDNWKGASP